MPGIDARTLACAAALFARSLNLRYDGIAIASRIPMMMMTTRSSMSVKPSSAWSRLRMASNVFSFSASCTRARGLTRYVSGVTGMSLIPQPGGWASLGKSEGRVAAPLAFDQVRRVLRAGARDDVRGRAGLHEDRRTHGGLDAVGRRRGRLDQDVLD